MIDYYLVMTLSPLILFHASWTNFFIVAFFPIIATALGGNITAEYTYHGLPGFLVSVPIRWEPLIPWSYANYIAALLTKLG